MKSTTDLCSHMVVLALVLAIFLDNCSNVFDRVENEPYNIIKADPFLKPEDEWVLSRLLSQKSVLVVGGDRDIGLNISLAIARYGGDVSIVGTNELEGRQAVEQMELLASSNMERYPQKFDSFVYDLYSPEECLKYTNMLQENGLLFDIVILTMGVWPTAQIENSTEYIVEENFVSRLLILDGIRELLKPGATVINAVGSGCLETPETLPMHVIKDVFSGDRDSNTTAFEAMSSVCISVQTFMEQLSRMQPSCDFISTNVEYLRKPDYYISTVLTAATNLKNGHNVIGQTGNITTNVEMDKKFGPWLISSIEKNLI